MPQRCMQDPAGVSDPRWHRVCRYNDRLARERQEREDNLAKRRNEDLVNMQVG